MFFLAATWVGWIGGDYVYRKVAAKNTGYLLTDLQNSFIRRHNSESEKLASLIILRLRKHRLVL